MPLGLFSSGKAQVLADEKPAGSKKKEPKQLSENKCKGVTLKLDHTRVTIEKQIAEGGFAIVYIAADRKNNKFALKRQFTKENQKQLDACCREHSFLKQCIGHKNIVEFVDSYVNCLGNGIWECMLLTEYHQKNVLQLMNERISQNQYLTNDEILSIFCDISEAVSFIHHRPQPIIHRDLKVENVLISSHKPPNYVLCDFGSATTQTLTVEKFGVEYVKAEVERNTTMCYRSPEMIDIYSGQPIGLKSDMWALGVMLYRLCFFCVPFEESPLAIQSVNYSFPSVPNIPDEIKVLIYMLLDIDVNRRLSIYQLSALAFEAHRKALPREIEMQKTSSSSSTPTPSLDSCLRLMRDGKIPRNQKDVSPRGPGSLPPLPSVTTTSSVIAPPPQIATSSGEPMTTSVAPRLRPKATTVVPNVPSISPVPPIGLPNLKILPNKPHDETDSSQFRKPPIASADFSQRQSFSGEERLKPTGESGAGGPLSCPLMQPIDLGFKDLDNPALLRNRAQTDGKRRVQQEAESIFQQQHRRNVSDTSQISKSAFKPYSSQTTSKSNSQVRSVEDMSNGRNGSLSAEWNPFLAAPFSSSSLIPEADDGNRNVMDDSHFGLVFDEIRRKEVSQLYDSDMSSIDSRDPFGAAPFDQLTVSTSSSAPPVSLPPAGDEDDEKQLLSESDEEEEEKEEREETQTAKETQNVEEDSEIDEQRMNDRRRYSYENIDGVGDDASSDSRGKTDRDDSEEEEDDDSRRGGDTSHDEDSQNTVGSEDGEGGSRPLLEDDGLEDDDDHELISSFSSSTQLAPLFVGTSTPLLQNPVTNPFLRDELTPKMISPGIHSVDDDWDLGDRWTDRRDTVFERPPIQNAAFAPATLPRQVTPLAAVCKLKPDLPSAAPVSIIPSMSTTSFPEVVKNSEDSIPREPVIGTLISVGAPTDPPPKPTVIPSQPPVSIAKKTTEKLEKLEKSLKKEKKKEKKEGKKDKKKEETMKEKGSSERETDGSEAEMWADGGTVSKKKKKSTFGLRSSHPSIVANELQFVAPIPPSKKSSKDKKTSSAIKKMSVGNANSSFVNTSFQPEDPDVSNDL